MYKIAHKKERIGLQMIVSLRSLLKLVYFGVSMVVLKVIQLRDYEDK